MLRIPRSTVPRLAALVLAGGAVLVTTGATTGAARAVARPEPIELRLVLHDCPDQVQP
ncbi:hypothetical protein [Nonomuraea typhae]|uniref:hypothetical protein n=1 Tax=Nonomuraea typhae TaxID=2603600 RepID=UPI0012FCDD77|nr:hypothetical protein [Nonomuraea typhae]